MKKITQLLIIAILSAICFCVPAFAGGDKITVILNGNELSFNQAPVVENGTTLVPMRDIFEALNASVEWNAETKTISVYSNDDIMYITINSDTALVNDETYTLDAPAKIIEGTTFVPLRFISEQLGLKIDFDSNTKIIYITKDGEDIPNKDYYQESQSIPYYESFPDVPDFGKMFNLKPDTANYKPQQKDYLIVDNYTYYRSGITEAQLNEYLKALQSGGFSNLNSDEYYYIGINSSGTVVLMDLDDSLLYIYIAKALDNEAVNQTVTNSYSDFPTVPDFGKMCGANEYHRYVSPNGNGGYVAYDILTFSPDDLSKYFDVLEENGYVYDKEMTDSMSEESNESRIVYKRGNTYIDIFEEDGYLLLFIFLY